MSRRWAVIVSLGLMCISNVSAAQTNSIMEIMDEAVSRAPSVQIAQADAPRARASARRIAVSPYEFEVSASAGQRFIDDPLSTDSRFTEFGAGLSKTIRLPNKKRMDQRLSDVEIEISEIAIDVAIFEEKRAFINLWNAWSQAYRFIAISQQQAEDAAALASLELLKVEKGAGRQINADLLLAQSQMARLMAQRDQRAAERAKLNLQSRYPMIDLPDNPVILSTSPTVSQASKVKAVINYPAQRLAALQSESMRLRAQREALNKRPDPTLGLDVSDEFGGRETSVMARISIPLGGKLRQATLGETQAQAVKSEVEARLSYQMAVRDYELSKENANSYTKLIEAADAARTASQLAVTKIEKGYTVGAITAQELIIARKSLRDAERTYADYVGQADAAQLLLQLYTPEK